MKTRLVLLLLLLPLLCGCSFFTMERQIYPICLSVDAAEDGQICVGIQAPRSGTGDTVTYEILTATGSTPEEAFRLLAASTPYPLNFSQIRLCVVSYRLAASTPVRPLLLTLLQQPAMRPSAYVSIALGNALDVLQYQQPDFGMRLSTHLNLLITRARKENLLPDSMLSYCVRELADGACDPLIGLCAVNTRLLPKEDESDSSVSAFSMDEPWSNALLPAGITAGMLPHTSQNPVEYLGSVVMSDGLACGVLTAEETQLTLRLCREARLGVSTRGDRLLLQILLPGDHPLAQQETAILQLMQKTMTLRSDPLHFGCLASMRFLTDADLEAYDFRGLYPYASVQVAMK